MKPTNKPWLISALAGLALTCAVGLHPAPAAAQGIETTNIIAFTGFDTNTAWGYGYFYSWGWPASGQYTNDGYAYDYAYVDPIGTNTGAYFFTNTAFVDLMTNSGAGYGTGFGGGMTPMGDGFFNIYTNLSTNLFDYIFSFDARTEGLQPGQATANAEMQAQWFISGVNGYQLNFNFTLSSNWTHHEWLLTDYSGTDKGTLSNWVYSVQNWYISGMQWNVNLHQPDPAYGFDELNLAVVDNLRLDMIVRTGAPPAVPPIVSLPIIDWNMDDKAVWGGWGAYNWSALPAYMPTFTWSPAAAGYGVGGSNAWILQMDNSMLAPPNTPAWSGGGCGDNGPTDYTLFTSGDPKAYKITFDGKATGLNPLRTDPTTCTLQLFLDTANGNYRVDVPLAAGIDWVNSSFDLSQLSWNAADGRLPKASFSTNYTVTALRIQLQIENSSNEGDWGYDNDNVLAVDNIKIDRLYEACPPLTITDQGASKLLTWAQPNTGSAKLQSASDVAGTWSDVTGATSPYTYSGTGPKFFRTLWVAPPTEP